jgi:conjugative transfer signal peptidase TraF
MECCNAVRLRTRTPFVIAVIAGAIVFTAVNGLQLFGPPLFFNETPSEPTGIYRLVEHPTKDYQRGMYVIFPVPHEVQDLVYGRGWLRAGIPFLKELLGLPGDQVCISNTALRINDTYVGPVFERDSRGLPLPQRPGCFRVPDGSFFAASHHLPNSFDGRYFGALPLTVISGEAKPVWIF